MSVLTASQILCLTWQQRRHIDNLPHSIRPITRADGYAVQDAWPRELGGNIAGWKIAATSIAGQQHIGVSGPLAGPIFAHKVHADGAKVSLLGNQMRVAECEIVFGFGEDLAPRIGGYCRADILSRVAEILPGIEIPDSRFMMFERAGEAQLIADCACTNDMVLGAPIPGDHRLESLATHRLRAKVSDGRELTGVGANVLGDPVEALRWLVNELTGQGRTLKAGQFVTTGACVPPIPVQVGDAVQADFGWIGKISVEFC